MTVYKIEGSWHRMCTLSKLAPHHYFVANNSSKFHLTSYDTAVNTFQFSILADASGQNSLYTHRTSVGAGSAPYLSPTHLTVPVEGGPAPGPGGPASAGNSPYCLSPCQLAIPEGPTSVSAPNSPTYRRHGTSLTVPETPIGPNSAGNSPHHLTPSSPVPVQVHLIFLFI